MALQRMDNVGIVVEDLAAAIAFFEALGLKLLGQAAVDGAWVDRLIDLSDVRVEIATLQTPDGHGRVELTTFRNPRALDSERNAPVNMLGIRRIMFAVDDLDERLERLRSRGAELLGEVTQYRDLYRLCYVRGPEGILVALAQQLR